MSHFQRMIAIPEDEYSQLGSVQQVYDPSHQQFTKLSNQYDRQNFIQDPNTRAHRQGETLDETKKLKDDLRERVRPATPKPYQSRAESLYDFLKNKLSFYEIGELLDNDKKPIVDSNISDLIQHAVRDSRRNMTPIGWQSFLTTQQSSIAPKMLISYDTLEELRSLRSSAVAIIAKRGSSLSPLLVRNIKQEVHTPHSRIKKVAEKDNKPRKREETSSKLRKDIKKPDRYLFAKKFY